MGWFVATSGKRPALIQQKKGMSSFIPQGAPPRNIEQNVLIVGANRFPRTRSQALNNRCLKRVPGKNRCTARCPKLQQGR